MSRASCIDETRSRRAISVARIECLLNTFLSLEADCAHIGGARGARARAAGASADALYARGDRKANADLSESAMGKPTYDPIG
jgi:hypothetical protein